MSEIQNITPGLIPVGEHDGRQAVSGRALHEFLEIETAYNIWFGRMLNYGFDENRDFQTFLIESSGGRPGADHALSLDMAKEISMIQRSDKGKQARLYFIEMEKKATGQRALTPDEIVHQALQITHAKVQQLEAKVERDAPKVDYVDTYVADGDLRLLRNVAKSLGMTESELRADLLGRKWIYVEHTTRWSETKQAKETIARYSAYAHKAQYFDPVPNHLAPRFKGEVMHTLKVTPAGAVAIARLYGKHIQAVEDVA